MGSLLRLFPVVRHQLGLVIALLSGLQPGVFLSPGNAHAQPTAPLAQTASDGSHASPQPTQPVEPPSANASAGLTRPKARLDLSPRTAAVLEMGAEQAGPSAPPPQGELGLAERMPGLVRSNKAAAAQRLEHAAEDAIWQVLKPWQMRLKEGRYWYMGRGFDAAILPDGSIEYRAKEGVTLSFVPTMTRSGVNPGRGNTDADGKPVVGGAPTPGIGIGLADPGSALTRAVTGQDFHTSERREFLQKTQALREHLSDLARQRNQLRADELLVETLRRLWQAPRAELAKQQAATFKLWESCADDELGNAARARIEAFVRELASERGQCPFSPKALQGFNRHRQGARAFDPCAAKGAGTLGITGEVLGPAPGPP